MKQLLIISQVYVPDPASLGQHMHDAAAELVRRGHRVIVYTARAGYGDARQRYPARETRDGVEIRRLPLGSLGKRSMAMRLIGGLLFLFQATLRSLFVRRIDGVLISTSPPMAPLAALMLRAVRRVPFVFWVMDVNPDQAIAMSQAKPGGVTTRLLDGLIGVALRKATHVVTLDRFMRERLCAKVAMGERISVLPPWPHEDHLESVAHADNPFRTEYRLTDKLVLMYSGNISPSHPLTTLLEAAKRLQDEQNAQEAQKAQDAAPDVVFLFIGDGLAREELVAFAEREGLVNVRFLPYQPLEQLRLSLSAADVHMVAMGEAMVGIVHPCKLYGAMAVARPVLLLGPGASHVGEILEAHKIGWRIDHGDVEGAVATIRRIAELARTDPAALAAMGRRARQVIDIELGKAQLCAAFCDIVERPGEG